MDECGILLSAPSWGRELKRPLHTAGVREELSAPSWGCELKLCIVGATVSSVLASALLEGYELKHYNITSKNKSRAYDL